MDSHTGLGTSSHATLSPSPSGRNSVECTYPPLGACPVWYQWSRGPDEWSQGLGRRGTNYHPP